MRCAAVEAPVEPAVEPPQQVDAAIYTRVDDPNDPFAYKYAEFRARRARELFSLERSLDQHVALYRSLLAGAP